MGRLIDADAVKKKYPLMENDFGMIFNEGIHKAIDSMPTVEAIPKTEYEARLKADLKAILTELQLEIEEMQSREVWCDYATDNCIDRCGVDAIIRLKINELKGEQMSSISATQYGQIIEDIKEHTDQYTEQTEDEKC